MSVALITPPTQSDPQRKRFTRSEVDQMAESGLFADQRLELIAGDLIDKMGQKPQHASAIRLVQTLLAALFGFERVQVQLPVEVSSADQESSLPEPDISVLKETSEEFRQRFPSGHELALVIEVADTSLRQDLTTKRALYARAGVPEYWVLDLRGRCLIVHRLLTESEYQDIAKLAETDTATLGGGAIPVARMLP